MIPILYSIFIFPFAPDFAFAQSVSGTIQIPANFTADILTQSTSLLNALEGFVALIVGVLLALVVIEHVIGAIRHRN